MTENVVSAIIRLDESEAAFVPASGNALQLAVSSLLAATPGGAAARAVVIVAHLMRLTYLKIRISEGNLLWRPHTNSPFVWLPTLLSICSQAAWVSIYPFGWRKLKPPRWLILT